MNFKKYWKEINKSIREWKTLIRVSGKAGTTDIRGSQDANSADEAVALAIKDLKSQMGNDIKIVNASAQPN